jgi:hypothetical protein
VDRVLIDQKLETLRHCLVRVAGKCPPDATTLAEDIDLQDILVLNLTRSVQLCVDIASHIIAASSELPRTFHNRRRPANLMTNQLVTW